MSSGRALGNLDDEWKGSPESEFDLEVRQGKRFLFGENWQRFLRVVDEDRVARAETSLREMLGVESLEGRTFLDVGSGSGLFSLAARRLGAVVHSFDFDPTSVACTCELRRRFFAGDEHWTIERGSVLDTDYLGRLGTFDVVYAWGVLHHTGEMWQALANVIAPVADGGTLFIGIYNDAGLESQYWLRVKRLYCSGRVGRALVTSTHIPYYFVGRVAKSLLTGKNQFREYRRNRGMSAYHDWFDWLGGHPYEFAGVESLRHFYRHAGFELSNLKTGNRLGINELVLRRTPGTGPPVS